MDVSTDACAKNAAGVVAICARRCSLYTCQRPRPHPHSFLSARRSFLVYMIPNIPSNSRWASNGVTVAGGHERGNATTQLCNPYGLFIYDDQTMIIVDSGNHRIIEWKMDEKNGYIVAGDNSPGNRLDQLNWPTDVIIEKETDSLIICDRGNQRVVRWPCHKATAQGEIIVSDINCFGLTMDDQKYLYVSDTDNHEVRRYKIGDKNGTIIAGGHGKGDGLNQLNYPTYIFVDRQQTLYVSDHDNHRVMKWNKDGNEGIVVAGGRGKGETLTQLSFPNGLFVDTLGTIYVADSWNHRVMRWSDEAKQGTVIVGGNSWGGETNQLHFPTSLSFDRHGNLYIVDQLNYRVQRFSIE
ncbi:unnamed protein product [Rotaria sp. Silwood2]|nr:unnamed protein product [Rotaria sp. Silwood2]CAF4538545.1 unnamed protein product [Rotaria sp. Silwood2]